MKNIKNMLWCVIIVSSVYGGTAEKAKQETNRLQLEKIYKGLSGYGLSAEDCNSIVQQGGAPTYGEITYDSVQSIIKILNPTKQDIFYDLGCGVGKAVIQMYLNSPVKKVVGVELSCKRYNQAQEAKHRLKKNGLLKKNRILEFKKEDIAKTSLKDATIVYLCSTCYSEELMKAITKNLEEGNKNLRVLTLKPLPLTYEFELVKEYNLAMSWSDGSSAYLYKRKLTKQN